MRYCPERKEAVLKKMLPSHNRSIPELAEEEGISEATLYAWRKATRAWGDVIAHEWGTNLAMDRDVARRYYGQRRVNDSGWVGAIAAHRAGPSCRGCASCRVAERRVCPSDGIDTPDPQGGADLGPF